MAKKGSGFAWPNSGKFFRFLNSRKTNKGEVKPAKPASIDKEGPVFKAGRLLGRLRASFLAGFYSVHVKIRYLHDKTYAKGGGYKKWSDKKYSSLVHKTVLVSFVVSFFIFSILPSLFPYFFNPNMALAGANTKTWTTKGDFQSGTPDANINLSGTNAGDDSSTSLNYQMAWTDNDLKKNVPEGRSSHTVIWTGETGNSETSNRMIVWGGGASPTNYGNGGIYSPATNTWKPVSLTNSPSPRSAHSAIWTGSKMIVWGGSPSTNTGGIYDPATDSWTATSTTNAPVARYDHTAIWTGSKMIVWGGSSGSYMNTGGVYDPATNSWTATSTTNAPVARYSHSVIWTGTEMIVWGGYPITNTGGRYNPDNDTWTTISLTNAPAGRYQHSAVWTGSKMIIWGGYTNTFVNSGGVYDPATDTWTATSYTNAPSARSSHSAIWTGSKMIIWGGYYVTNTGGIYDPSNDTWTSTSTTGSPSARYQHRAIWTGTEMILWGGYSSGYLNTGGIYLPDANSWTSINAQSNLPAGRNGHTAIWTGSKMIIWGGSISGNPTNTGGVYDPATDTWIATSTVNAPTIRYGHTAVWTGSKMIVWGGTAGTIDFKDTGGIYDPATDTWMATSITNAPVARRDASAVWTGSKMIIWGGYAGYSNYYNSGGIYDPATNTWTATSTTNVPTGRYLHTVIWTGSKMIVWGGNPNTNTGGIYDPDTDSWAATSTTSAPTARFSHTAVWTGSKMIIWGGTSNPPVLNTGGQYDPSTDSWTATSTTNAPVARAYHTAVWTGSKMIVWGGSSTGYLNTGGQYDASNNNWSATSTLSVQSRSQHKAVWTGSQMIVWGGYDDYSTYSNTGGIYAPTYSSPGLIPSFHLNAQSTATFSALSWNGTTPANTAIKFRTRSASTEGGLTSATWSDYITVSGTNINSPPNQWLEVEVTLESSDGANTPTLNDFTVTYDTLDSITNSNIILTKTDGTVLKTSTGTTVSGGMPDAWSNSTTLRVTTNSLACTDCATTPTNLRPEVEIKSTATTFDGTNTYTATAGNTYVDIPDLTPGTAYHLRVRSLDDQGRVSAWTSYGNNAENVADFTIDQTAPTGTVSVEDGADYATSTSVTLTLSASDTGGSNLQQMRFSNDGTTWSDWETYATSKAWTLTSGDGAKTVYGQFRDNANNTTGKVFTSQADWEAGSKSSTDITTLPGSVKSLFAKNWTTLADNPGTYVDFGGNLEYNSFLNKIKSSPGNSTSGLHEYNYVNNTWITINNGLPEAPSYTDNIAIDSSNGYMYYVRGGFNNQYYVHNTTSWSASQSIPGLTTCAYAKTEYYDNYIYVGCWDSGTSLMVFKRMNLSSLQWEDLVLPSVGFGTYGALTSDYNGNLYKIATGSNKLQRYNIGLNQWTDISTAPFTFGEGANSIYLNGYLYTIQGESTTIWRYDVINMTWESYAEAPLGIRKGGDIIYVPSANSFFVQRGAMSASFYKLKEEYSSPATISNLKFNPSQTSKFKTINWNGETPANTTIKFRTRTAATEGGLAAATWSDYYTSSGSTIASADNLWLEVELTLESTDGVNTPTLYDFNVESASLDSIILDTTPPSNITNIKAYSDFTKSSELTASTWYPISQPYFEWDASADPDFDHYLYCFETSASCTPAATAVTNSVTINPAISFEGTHYLRVVAVDEAGQSSVTPTTFIYKYDATAPGAVTGLSASITELTKISVSWNAYGDGASPVDNYKLERVKDSGNQYQIGDDWTTAPGYAVFILTGTTFDDVLGAPAQGQESIEASTKYQYRIRVKDVSNPDYSIFNATKVYGMTNDLQDPTPVVGVFSAACDGTTNFINGTTVPRCSNIANKGFEIAITWTPSTDSGTGIGGYNIYRSNTAAVDSYTKIATVTGSVTNFYYDNDANNDANATTRLNDYTTYYYRITAFDMASTPNETDLIPVGTDNATSALTPDVTSPSAPLDVTASALGIDSSGTRQKVQITWSASTDTKARSVDPGSGIKTSNGNIIGYKIYRATNLGGPYTDITTDPKVSCDQNSRVCYNEDLDEYPAIYYYRLTATDNYNNVSTNSDSASVQTASSAVPTAPANVTVTTKTGNPNTDTTVGHQNQISFKGSFAKNCANNLRCLTKYELWRSTTNYVNSADWVDPAKATKIQEFTPTVTGDDRGTTYNYTDTGLTDATTYYYKVRALDNTPAVPDGGPFYSPLSTITTGTLHAGWDTTADATAPKLPANGLEVKVRDTHPSDTEYRNIITWVMLVGDDVPTRNGASDFARYELHRQVIAPASDEVLSDTKVTDITDLAENYYIDRMDLALGSLKYRYYILVVDNADTQFKYFDGTVINNFANFSEIAFASDTITPDKTKPTLTQPIRIASVGVSSAVITWQTDQDTDSIVEFRPKGSTGEWSIDGKVDRTQNHSTTLVNMQPNTAYEYRIVSRNYLGNNVEYDPADLPPLTTTGFNITPGSVVTTTTTAEINWTTNLNASSAFVEYQLQRQPGDEPQSGTAGVSAESLAANARNHKVIIKGLRSNRAYTYKIKSISSDGYLSEYPTGGGSNFETFRTKAYDTGQFTLAPSSSNVAERNITSTNAQIVWETAVPTTTWVDYGTKSGVYDVSAGNNDLTTQHVVLIDGLTPGQTYYYRVRVRDSNEVEYTSQEYSFRAVLKPKISGLQIKEITPYSVTIAWETNIETETLINWGRTTAYGEKKGTSGTTKQHEIKIEGLEDNSEYHFQILARDETGEEVAADDNIVRTPLDTEGPKIEGLKIDILPLGESDETAQVIISWKTNKPSTTLVQYDLGIVGGNYTKSSIEDTTLTNTHTVIIKDLEVASTYHYRIVARDKRDNKTITNDYTFVTPEKNKSIWQLIVRSLEETFSWVKNIGSFFQNIGKKTR